MNQQKLRGVVRLTLILVLVSVGVLSSMLTYSYWASQTVGAVENSEANVEIGNGLEAKTTVAVVGQSSNELLVPTNQARNSGEGATEEIVMTFPVKWLSQKSGTATGAKGLLTTEIKSITIGNDEKYSQLINATILQQKQEITADGDQVNISVSFTMNEPATKEVYEAIINQKINAQVSFSVSPIE